MGSIVQSKFGGTSPGASVAITLDANPTPGNKLVALMTTYSTGSDGTLTASGGGTWTTRASPATATCRTAIAVCESATGGATTVTVSSSGGGGQFISAIILEVSGLDATSFDVAASNTGNSSGAYNTGTTAAPAQANNFVVGILSATNVPTMSTPSGFTSIGLLDDSATYQPYSVFYRNITAIAAQSASITSGTSSEWAGAIVVLKDAGGGGSNKDLEGAAAGSASATGDLTATGGLQGAAVGGATVAGAVSVGKGLVGAATGSANAAAEFARGAGDLFLVDDDTDYSLVDGDAAVDGYLEELSGGTTHNLAGTAAATASVAAALSLGKAPSGAAVAASVVGGGLTVVATLIAASLSRSTPAGNLAVVIPFAGGSAGTSVVAGQVAVVKPLAASAQAAAAVQGTLGQALPLQGLSAAAVAVAGSTSIGKPLAGASVSIAGAAGALEVTPQGVVDLAGGAAARSTPAGVLQIQVHISAAALSQALVAANLSTSGSADLSGAVLGRATPAAALSLSLSIAGAVAGIALGGGTLQVQAPSLAGASLAQAAAAGGLTVSIDFTGAALAQALAGGALTSAIDGAIPLRRLARPAREYRVTRPARIYRVAA
ncbi:hypothetical protein [Arenimonas sp.]|uniref:hypothetical protein n=1 Tax=Arenimonas sp. TaxID=1872635 RepID=UPI0025B7E009|nr:hypothetical protein [Arenimonas sp.]